MGLQICSQNVRNCGCGRDQPMLKLHCVKVKQPRLANTELHRIKVVMLWQAKFELRYVKAQLWLYYTETVLQKLQLVKTTPYRIKAKSSQYCAASTEKEIRGVASADYCRLPLFNYFMQEVN